MTTGIYECNSQCGCSAACLNRVAQLPLRQSLQIFRTAERGWGLRTLHDIPAGTFICVYVGRLYTAEEGNRVGRSHGDEYFADLDFIEVVERVKLEELVLSDEGFLDYNSTSSNDMGSDYQPSKSVKQKKTKTRKRKKRKTESKASENALKEQKTEISTAGQVEFRSLRKLFGEDEEPYIMDAKTTGNIGKYLNHSCSPNVFAQNVFVDTHDARYTGSDFEITSEIQPKHF